MHLSLSVLTLVFSSFVSLSLNYGQWVIQHYPHQNNLLFSCFFYFFHCNTIHNFNKNLTAGIRLNLIIWIYSLFLPSIIAWHHHSSYYYFVYINSKTMLCLAISVNMKQAKEYITGLIVIKTTKMKILVWRIHWVKRICFDISDM